MVFVFWDDPYSKFLESAGYKNMSLAWKVMNFSGKIWIVILLCNLLVVSLGFGIFWFDQSDPADLSVFSKSLFALAALAFFVAGFFMMFYGLCGAYLAYKCGEYLWFIAILVMGILAFIYRHYKIVEIEAGTLKIKN